MSGLRIELGEFICKLPFRPAFASREANGRDPRRRWAGMNKNVRAICHERAALTGELMFLLEYRDEKISLAYSRDFSLPDNLYFVGTMNTADRSIRNIDVALRRRFEVFECEPSAEILAAHYRVFRNNVPDLIAGFEKLNATLERSLDRYHTIGHSFFMADDFNHKTLTNIWKRRIKPLVEELFFDEPDKSEGLTLEALWPSLTAI